MILFNNNEYSPSFGPSKCLIACEIKYVFLVNIYKRYFDLLCNLLLFAGKFFLSPKA